MSALVPRFRVSPPLESSGRASYKPDGRFAMRLLCVLKAWIRNPTQVATVMPSSDFLIDRIANRDCVRNATTLVELGPGAGGTTAGLLSRMPTDARLLAIEKTAEFREVLSWLDDTRLVVEIADAIDLLKLLEEKGLGAADVIVSGIPFSSIPPVVAKTIMQAIYESLKPGGALIAYQLHSDIDALAQPLFGPSTKERVPWNLPPLTVYTWVKVR